MTDEEIKKALECCVEPKHDCSNCLLKKEVYCTSLLHKNILDLINRQQAEIDDLKRDTVPKLQDSLNRANKYGRATDEENARLKAEIERLKWEKDHFEFKVDDLNGKLEKFKEYIYIKNEANEREIERLQGAVQEWVDGKCLSQKHLLVIGKLQNEIEQAKAEAIKEFAERLKSKYTNVVSCNAGYVYGTIKEVEKEMVGGENA